jgi:hypothetical protein
MPCPETPVSTHALLDPTTSTDNALLALLDANHVPQPLNAQDNARTDTLKIKPD